MLRIILIGLIAVIGVLAIVIQMQPAAFVIERSAQIQAPASVIYPHIAGPRAMNQWSPFALGDPQMQIEYSGPESGVGARSDWQSKQMGNGGMTVTEAKADQEVTMRLDFLTPMKQTNTARFTLTPEGSGTRVTWSMSGNSNFVGKAFGLLMNTDKMVGGMFEQGLASMKKLAESEAAGQPS
jgi:polyketide cyclase/dehydrase/lipid transport protein